MGKRNDTSTDDGHRAGTTARDVRKMARLEDIPAKGRHAADNKGKGGQDQDQDKDKK